MDRLGSIKIDRIDVVKIFSNEVVDIFYLLKFIPVKVEFWHINATVEYVGISERFEKVPKGAIIPEYFIEVIKDEEGKVQSVNCKKSL